MTPSPRAAWSWIIALIAVGLMAVATVLADRLPALALINESPSLPRGVYIRQVGTQPAPGAVVATPQPLGARPYLARLGMPAEVVLIKRVAAAGGDRVCRRGDQLITPRGPVVVRERDRRGVELPSWRGCRRLGREELFLLGDTASSFDSRYFGPVQRTQVTGVYKEMLTW